MRFSVACLVLAAAGATSACAAITGLDGYQSGQQSSTGADASSDAFALGDDASTEEPLTDDSNDASSSSDAMSAYVDALDDLGDAPPPCGPMTCLHCCFNGSCQGGGSVNSCGVNGAECQDCTDKGGACSNGACTTKVVDAAPPPTCDPGKCGGCAPVWEKGCCKSDGTCGCSMDFGSGPCN